MKILIICHDLPSPSNATSLRVLGSLKYLSEKYKHNIMLLAFKRGEEYPDLSNYCQVKTIDRLTLKNKVWTIVNMLSPKNIFSTTPNLLNYSPKMGRKVTELLIKHKFDVIAIDHFSMLYYTLEIGIPQVLLEIMPTSKIYKTYFHLEKNLLIKMLLLLQYYTLKKFEKNGIDLIYPLQYLEVKRKVS